MKKLTPITLIALSLLFAACSTTSTTKKTTSATRPAPVQQTASQPIDPNLPPVAEAPNAGSWGGNFRPY